MIWNLKLDESVDYVRVTDEQGMTREMLRRDAFQVDVYSPQMDGIAKLLWQADSVKIALVVLEVDGQPVGTVKSEESV